MIVVLTAATTGIARIVVFGDPGCWARSGSRRPGGERVDDAPRVMEMRLVVTADLQLTLFTDDPA